MADTRAAQLRRLWLNVHLWIALGLCALLVPISISGGLLVWHDEIDAWINPQRYAISGSQALLPPVVYLAQAQEAVVSDPAKPRATALRYPEPGWPMRVVMRAQASEAGARPRVLTVYLDPSTARILDVVDFRSSFFGFLHVFHENLTIPEYSGRQIVGWAGVGMLVLSLTGLWLWWPRNGFVRGLRWRRSPLFTFNLHSLLGFWISLPLAVVSATGIYLSFPQTARQAMSSIAPMTPQGQRPGFGQIAQHTVLTADQALAAALASEPNGKPVALFLPVQQRERPLTWRTQISRAGSADVITLMTDDRTGQTSLGAAPPSGDRAAAWIRWIHEGSHSGPVWAVAVTLTGIFPTIFAVTGIIMWLRKRAGRKELGRKSAKPRLRPAE